MEKFKLYLFDFDGTLCDTKEALKMVFKRSYEKFGIKVNDEQCVRFSREPINIGFLELMGSMEKFWDFIEVINYYLNGEESINLSIIYEDTYRVHEYFKKNDILFGLVTSNNIPHCRDIYKAHALNLDDMAVLVGNQECHTPKPDPRPIQTALKMLGYDGDLKDVVYIGDSVNDAIAAQRVGIKPILLDRDNIYANEPYEIIHSLDELIV